MTQRTDEMLWGDEPKTPLERARRKAFMAGLQSTSGVPHKALETALQVFIEEMGLNRKEGPNG